MALPLVLYRLKMNENKFMDKLTISLPSLAKCSLTGATDLYFMGNLEIQQFQPYDI